MLIRNLAPALITVNNAKLSTTASLLSEELSQSVERTLFDDRGSALFKRAMAMGDLDDVLSSLATLKIKKILSIPWHMRRRLSQEVNREQARIFVSYCDYRSCQELIHNNINSNIRAAVLMKMQCENESILQKSLHLFRPSAFLSIDFFNVENEITAYLLGPFISEEVASTPAMAKSEILDEVLYRKARLYKAALKAKNHYENAQDDLSTFDPLVNFLANTKESFINLYKTQNSCFSEPKEKKKSNAFSQIFNKFNQERQVADRIKSNPSAKLVISIHTIREESGGRLDFQQTSAYILKDSTIEPLENNCWYGKSDGLTGLLDDSLIEFKLPDGTIYTLPAFENRNLLLYLKESNVESMHGYCCRDFANEITYGREIIPEYASAYNYHMSSLDELQCFPGDVVYMFSLDAQNNHRMIHYAVYIGGEYYLSVLGYDGDFGISTLNVFHEKYKYTHIAKCERLYRWIDQFPRASNFEEEKYSEPSSAPRPM